MQNAKPGSLYKDCELPVESTKKIGELLASSSESDSSWVVSGSPLSQPSEGDMVF